MFYLSGRIMKIGVCGNMSLNEYAESLDEVLPEYEIIVGETGCYREELVSPFGEFRDLDICVLCLNWNELTPLLHSFGYGDNTDRIIEEFKLSCESLKKHIEQYRKICSAKILIFSPYQNSYCTIGFIDRLQKKSVYDLWYYCQKEFNILCQSISDVYPVDIDLISNKIGKNNAIDYSTLYYNQQPFSQELIKNIGIHTLHMVVQIIKYPLKCLVLDLDNTLWGGIVGESDRESIVLGNSGVGLAYKDFQQEILKLYKQGVILAISSKNNTCDAMAVMEKNEHMLIKPSMISCFRINWDDKPKSIIEISEELNIGLDSILFVDDSISEREMVRTLLPDVEILELPDDPVFYVETLRRNTRFWPLQITQEDIVKRKFYARNRLRNVAKEIAEDLEKYLESLNILISVSKSNTHNLSRIAQLFNKTNQFNLTTKRYSRNELEELIKDSKNHLFCMDMSDRFGEYGIVAVALIINDTIDSFMLSCRAFGKRVETAFLLYILGFLKKEGKEEVFAQYINSFRNSISKDFYKDIGFAKIKNFINGNEWSINLKKDVISKIPHWITIDCEQYHE